MVWRRLRRPGHPLDLPAPAPLRRCAPGHQLLRRLVLSRRIVAEPAALRSVERAPVELLLKLLQFSWRVAQWRGHAPGSERSDDDHDLLLNRADHVAAAIVATTITSGVTSTHRPWPQRSGRRPPGR